MRVDKGLQMASGHPSGMPCLRGFAGSAALLHLTTLLPSYWFIGFIGIRHLARLGASCPVPPYALCLPGSSVPLYR